MTKPSKSPSSASAKLPFAVRNSPIHGRGVFAVRNIPADTFLIEYEGERISEKEANKRHGQDPDNPHHTFFFSLESGKLIDGGVDGSDARWINHACDPNCEAREEKGRVYIYSLNDIKRGEELNYDYGLVVEERQTKALKKAYECRCGSPECRSTMLAPPPKKKKKKAKSKKEKAGKKKD